MRYGERCCKGVHVRAVAGRADSCCVQDFRAGGDDSPQGQFARVDASYPNDVESILCGIRMSRFRTRQERIAERPEQGDIRMTSRYMLDTDIASYVIRGTDKALNRRVVAHAGRLCMSAITYHELLYGARMRESRRV